MEKVEILPGRDFCVDTPIARSIFYLIWIVFHPELSLLRPKQVSAPDWGAQMALDDSH
jgi:hypothetical protein